MSAVEIFQSPVGQSVRTVVIDGEPWFVGRDIAAALGYANGSRDITRHTGESQRREYRIGTPSGEQAVVVLNEAGVYRMIMRSNMPRAIEFQDWIAGEVLPAIRRAGSYSIEATYHLPATYAEALRELASTVEERDAAVAQVAELAPKADLAGYVLDATGDFSVADAAKVLSRDPAIRTGPQRLFNLLATWGWLYRQTGDSRWRPYQTAVESGWLSELPASHYHPRTGELVLDAPQVRITPKGLLAAHKRMGGVRQLALPAATT